MLTQQLRLFNFALCQSDKTEPSFVRSTAVKAADIASSDYVISPLTGEKIPANKIQEHMRIGKRTFLIIIRQNQRLMHPGL